MKTVWKTRLVILALILVTGATVAARRSYRARRPLPPWESVWRLRMEASFEAPDSGAKVRLELPRGSPNIRVYRESFLHPGLRLEQAKSATGAREVIGRISGAREGSLIAELDLHLSPEGAFPDRRERVSLKARRRAEYLSASPDLPADSMAVQALAAELSSQPGAKTEVLDRAFAYCYKQLVSDELSRIDSAEETLAARRGTPLGCARALASLLRALKLPARLAVGFEIKEDPTPEPRVWVQAFEDGAWKPFDPSQGYARELPPNILTLRRGDHRIFRFEGVADADTSFDYEIGRARPPSDLTAARAGSWLDIVELNRLPLGLQRTLALLLLLPLGALVTALFRNVVGVVTFGTFGPTLLALAFLFADWKTGLVMAAAILLVGVLLRYTLDPLRLLMVPRLGVLLTIVVFGMITGVSALQHFGWVGSGQAVLLPMVILTGLIERLFITVEEDGAGHTGKRIAGTVLVGFCCYLVLNARSLGQVLLTYPELHGLTIAALVWVGRYSGYRVSELLRFKDLATSIPAGPPAPESPPKAEEG